MAKRVQPRTRRRVREEGSILSDSLGVNSSIFERSNTEELGLRDILFEDLKFESDPVETEKLSNLPNHQSKKIKTEFDSQPKRGVGDLIRNSVLLEQVKPEPVEQKVVINHYEEIILSDSSSDTDGQSEHKVEELDFFDKSFEIIDYSQLDTTEISQLITNPSDSQKIKQETEIKLEHNAFANTRKESVLSDADEEVDAVNSDDLEDKVPNFATNYDKVTESSQSYSQTEDCEDNEEVEKMEQKETEDISFPINISLNDYSINPEKEDGEIFEPDCNKTILVPPARNINSTGRLNKSSFSIIREWLANQDKSDGDSQVTFGIKTSQHYFKREVDKSRNMETSSTDSAKDRSNNSNPSRADSRSQQKKSHEFKRSPSNSRSRNRRSHKSKRNHSHSRSKKSKSPDSNASHSNSRSRDRRSDRKPNRFSSRNTNKRSNSKTRLSDFERNSKQSCSISGSPDIKPPNLNTSHSISTCNDKAYKTQISGAPVNSQTSITLDNASKASTPNPTTLKLENTTSPINMSPQIVSIKPDPEIHDTYINQQQFSTIDVSDGETVILDDFPTINTSKKRRRRSAEDIQIIEERSPSSITRNENRGVSSTTLKERMRSLSQTDITIRPKLAHKDLGTQVLVFDPTTDPVTYHEGKVTGIVDGTRVQVTRYDGQITDVDVFTSNNFNAVVQNVVPTKPGNVSIF